MSIRKEDNKEAFYTLLVSFGQQDDSTLGESAAADTDTSSTNERNGWSKAAANVFLS